MPRGGHARSGPLAHDQETRALRGGRERAHHREKGATAATPMVVCTPPPGLSRAEQAFWKYYAPQLAAERRLTLKARDTLAKYCTALAVIAGLRRQLTSRRRADVEQRSEFRKELRQWLLASRLYENDLLLNPSSSLRAPSSGGVGQPAGSGAGDPVDPFAEFDEPEGTH